MKVKNIVRSAAAALDLSGAVKPPKEIGLVYWDYYHADEEFYKIQLLGREFVQSTQRKMSFDGGVAGPAVQTRDGKGVVADGTLTDNRVHERFFLQNGRAWARVSLLSRQMLPGAIGPD